MGETLDLATLVVKLQADIKQYQTDLKSAKSSAAEFEKTAESLDKELDDLSKGGLKEAGQAVEQFAQKGAASLQGLEDDLKGLSPAADGVGRSMGNIGTAVDTTAVRTAAYEAKVREARAALKSLGDEVASGNKTLEQAAGEYKKVEGELEKYRRELGLVDDAQEQANTNVTQGGLKWTEFASKLLVAKQALTTIAAVGREVYATIGEGAELELAEQRFSNLTESIGSTSDAMLHDLSAATGGMMSDAQMMASASQIISLGLANTQTDVVDLASLVSQLGWDMQQVIMTFANNSKARLDALGLSVTDVNARMKEFEAQGYDTDRAFDMAVIAAGKDKLALLGSAAGTTVGDMARLEAGIANVTDGLKTEFADAAAPAVNWLADLAQGFVETGRAADAAHTSVTAFINSDDLKTLTDYRHEMAGVSDAIDEVGSHGSPFSPLATVDTRESLLLLLADLGRTSATTDVMQARFKALGAQLSDTGVEVNGMGVSWVELNKAMAELDERERLASITAGFADVDAKLANLTYSTGEATDTVIAHAAALDDEDAVLRAVNRTLIEYGGHLGDTTTQQEDEYWATLDAADAKKTMLDRMDELAKKSPEEIASIQAQVAAFSSLNTAVSGIQDPISDLIQAQSDLADAQGEWVNVSYDNANEIADINAQLAADLTNDQKAAMNDILRTTEEGSAEWLAAWDALQGDLSESARNALVAQAAALGEGGMSAVFTGDAEAAEDAQKRIEAANTAISESYRNTALDIVQARMAEVIADGGEGALDAQLAIINMQEAMGLISGDEAAAMEEFAVKTDKVTTATNLLLDEYLSDGVLAQQEIDNLAAAVGLVEESTDASAEAIAIFADTGVSDFEDVSTAVTSLYEDVTLLADGEYPIEVDDDEIEGARTSALLLINQLGLIPQNIPVHVSITSDPIPALPTGPGSSQQPQAFAGGGYTGNAGGIVHPNEFVFSPEAVRSVGVSALNDMHNAARAGGLSRMGGGDMAINIAIDARGNDNANEIARAASDELMTAARRMGLKV